MSVASSWDEIPTLVGTINDASRDLNGANRTEARRKCLAAARSLVFSLETPVESIIRNCWAEQGHHAAIRSAIRMKLFEKWTEGDGDVKSSLELANITGADQCLIGRFLKHLAAMGSIREVDVDKYAATPFSTALKQPIYRDAYPAMFDLSSPSFFMLPNFLDQTDFQNPTDPGNGAFQLGHHTTDHLFKWVSERPEVSSQFSNHMAGYRTGRPSWMDLNFYPVQANLVEGAEKGPNDVFLVDIGGSKGHDLTELCQKHPNLPGRLILQDLKGVIEEARASALDPKIIPMEHDFFTEQPIKGARAYYMHSCLHDWPNSRAREILLALRAGMKKGYSKLLINENVIPDKDAHWISTALDMVMMVNFSAEERTEENWNSLLESAGFRIVKIWTCEPGTESLIEAEMV